tara:strand:- start:8414 stop:9442 length:1029 start_codon:yes stop_codon:yes gene_type:complete
MKRALNLALLAGFLSLGLSQLSADEPLRFVLKARASEIDPLAKPHPEIGFIFEKDGKPQDVQVASVDTRVKAQGKLVIWMMGHNDRLFERLNSYGLHAIQPHYANRWFSLVCREEPVGDMCRGNVRLEAATGEDFSEHVAIPKPDGMMERTRQFLIWLSQENLDGNWGQFLTKDQSAVRWDKVIMAGSSHGSTTSARFAKHQKVDRVVMLCGPRDQLQIWQSLPSATAPNRYFGFSHVLDGGWTADHYCRSWELLGLHEFGPIVNIDDTASPYQNSRRLISAADVKNDSGRAHSAVTPGGASPKDENGVFLYEPVWKYLFTHPVDQVGTAVPMDDGCEKNQR